MGCRSLTSDLARLSLPGRAGTSQAGEKAQETSSPSGAPNGTLPPLSRSPCCSPRGCCSPTSLRNGLVRAQESCGGRAPILGIDLGTSFARAGVWQGGDVVLIRHGVRSCVAMPCWVAFTPEGVLTGEAAMEQADANLENTVYAPQRLIGCRIDNPWVQWYMKLWPAQVLCGPGERPLLKVLLCGQEQFYRPEELLGMLLSAVRKGAEKQLGRPVVDVCVTVPARYGNQQRQAIIESCAEARLNVVRLVRAPTAGGIAYTLTNRASGNILVCDMGSTYFDFVLLHVEGDSLTERAFGTDHVDFNRNLLQYCLEDLKEKWGLCAHKNLRVISRLERACDAAKKHLSQYTRARMEIKNLTPNLNYSCMLSRSYFEELCREDLLMSLEPLLDCLEDVGLERCDVKEVVLVGGSAHIPVLKRALCEFFHGLKPVEVSKPEHAAVLGAAAFAASLSRPPEEVPSQLRKLELKEAPTDLGGERERKRAESFPPKPRTRALFSATLSMPASMKEVPAD